MKVSVVVPVYNVEKYLRRCLDSLVNQTLKEIEIICVNDKSPDDSLHILREYETKYPDKIIIIDSKVNLRQGGARNLGINKASGEYIGFVDSDDWVKLDMFEKLYNQSSQTKSELVYCDYYTATSESGPFTNVRGTQHVDWDKPVEQIKRQLLVRPSSICSAIYSRNLFIDHNLFFPEKLLYEDNFIVPLLLSHAQSIKHVDEPLLIYYVGNVSTTRSFNNENFFDRIVTAKRMLEESRARGLNAYKDEIEFFYVELYLINTTVGCLKNFFPVRFGKLMEIRKAIYDDVPEFEKNPYFIQKMAIDANYRKYVKTLLHAPYLFLLKYGPYSFLKVIKKKIEAKK